MDSFVKFLAYAGSLTISSDKSQTKTRCPIGHLGGMASKRLDSTVAMAMTCHEEFAGGGGSNSALKLR